MNVARLRELARTIRAGTYEFDMDSVKVASCRTPGCVAGTAAALWPEECGAWSKHYKFLHSEWSAIDTAKCLGLSEEQMDALFFPGEEDGDVTYSEITREQAAATIDRLIETGRVYWNLNDDEE